MQLGSNARKAKLKRMTIAAGMIGSNGIVLAADQCRICFAPNESQLDDQMLGRKITHLERHQAAYSVAGDDVTDEIGYTITAALDNNELRFDALETSLRNTVERKLFEEEMKEMIDFYGTNVERAILMGFFGSQVPERQLWRIRVAGGSSAKRVDGIAIIGAVGNTARFFEYYYEPNLSTEQLAFLGSHIVLMGNRIDSKMVKGLDVSVIDEAGFHFLNDTQKAPFIRKSHEIDTLIRQNVLDEI